MSMRSGGYGSSDEDNRQAALPVDTDNLDNADLSLPPTNGMEYLRRVVAEARKCPKVVVADIDMQRFEGKQTYSVEEESALPTTAETFRLKPEWQKQQMKMFNKVRQELQRLRQDESLESDDRDLPTDERGWCEFCHGASIASADIFNDVDSDSAESRGGTEWVQGERPSFDKSSKKENRNSSNPDGSAMEVDVTATSSSKLSGNEPVTSLILSLDHPVVEELIEWHVSWFMNGLPLFVLGPWLYALLAGLEKPLTPEMSSALRDLARTCIRLRAACTSNHDDNLPHYSLFICLVGRYFDQTDLAD